MATALSAFAATYALSAAECLVLNGKLGNRAPAFWRAMDPKETTPQADGKPITIANQAGSYVLAAADVLTVMKTLGPRGWSVFEYMFANKA